MSFLTLLAEFPVRGTLNLPDQNYTLIVLIGQVSTEEGPPIQSSGENIFLKCIVLINKLSVYHVPIYISMVIQIKQITIFYLLTGLDPKYGGKVGQIQMFS